MVLDTRRTFAKVSPCEIVYHGQNIKFNRFTENTVNNYLTQDKVKLSVSLVHLVSFQKAEIGSTQQMVLEHISTGLKLYRI